MKILVLNWRDIRNPTAGGAEIYTHEIAKRLVKKGVDITVFSSKFKDCYKEEVIDGVKIVRGGGKFTVYLKAALYFLKNRDKFGLII